MYMYYNENRKAENTYTALEVQVFTRNTRRKALG